MSATALDATLHQLEGRLAHPPVAGSFDEGELQSLPDPVCRYLRTSIAAGTPLARSARFGMRGSVKLGRWWIPFRARQVYLGQLCGRTSRDVDRTVDTCFERLGLTGRTSDRLDALSHGNQQRVQLIAALVNEPDLLVLDEPFSGLDPIAMGNMSELLAEVAAAGVTVLFSSHQLDLVEDLCEDVVIIDHGTDRPGR